MQIEVTLTQDGFLPDQFSKHATGSDVHAGRPVRSFPITLTDVPAGTKTFALTLVDDDAIPVAGFSWIHWIAANLPASWTTIPEDASRILAGEFVQGMNSNISRYVDCDDPAIYQRYTGPRPPDKTHDYTLRVYAVDTELDLTEGFYMNELHRALRGHVLASATIDLPSRA